MPTSEARILANQKNAAKSTGPKTAAGKENSRRNGLKHGLTGQGIVLTEIDEAEVNRRKAILLMEMAPTTLLGSILVGEMATLSVRMERSTKQEFAAVASNVRNAPGDFDEERYQRADDLMLGLGEDPRGNLRRLLGMPEGVDLIIQTWNDLRSDLNREGKPLWTSAHLVQAANLLGIRDEDARISPIGQLSRGIWGDFAGEIDDESGDADHEVLVAQSRARILETIAEEITALESLYETFDFETIALDRAEAGARASFDPSKEASLARRYESEARRGFYKALEAFPKAEAQGADKAVSAPTVATPSPARASGSLASSCETPQPKVSQPAKPSVEPSRPVSGVNLGNVEVVRATDGQPISIGRPVPVAS